MAKSILIPCAIAVFPSAAVSQARDTAGLGAALQRLFNQNTFVRVEADGLAVAGRIREIDNRDVIISRKRVLIQQIELVQSR